jgi:hypothetical protein
MIKNPSRKPRANASVSWIRTLNFVSAAGQTRRGELRISSFEFSLVGPRRENQLKPAGMRLTCIPLFARSLSSIG